MATPPEKPGLEALFGVAPEQAMALPLISLHDVAHDMLGGPGEKGKIFEPDRMDYPDRIELAHAFRDYERNAMLAVGSPAPDSFNPIGSGVATLCIALSAGWADPFQNDHGIMPAPRHHSKTGKRLGTTPAAKHNNFNYEHLLQPLALQLTQQGITPVLMRTYHLKPEAKRRPDDDPTILTFTVPTSQIGHLYQIQHALGESRTANHTPPREAAHVARLAEASKARGSQAGYRTALVDLVQMLEPDSKGNIYLQHIHSDNVEERDTADLTRLIARSNTVCAPKTRNTTNANLSDPLDPATNSLYLRLNPETPHLHGEESTPAEFARKRTATQRKLNKRYNTEFRDAFMENDFLARLDNWFGYEGAVSVEFALHRLASAQAGTPPAYLLRITVPKTDISAMSCLATIGRSIHDRESLLFDTTAKGGRAL